MTNLRVQPKTLSVPCAIWRSAVPVVSANLPFIWRLAMCLPEGVIKELVINIEAVELRCRTVGVVTGQRTAAHGIAVKLGSGDVGDIPGLDLCESLRQKSATAFIYDSRRRLQRTLAIL
jgi:hypothetical protein